MLWFLAERSKWTPAFAAVHTQQLMDGHLRRSHLSYCIIRNFDKLAYELATYDSAQIRVIPGAASLEHCHRDYTNDLLPWPCGPSV